MKKIITNHAKAEFSSKTTILGLMGLWRLSPGTKGHGGYRQGLIVMGPQRLSPGTKGPGGYRRGPGGRASWAPAAIAGDQGAQPQSARRLGRASVLGPGRLENLIRKSNQIIYCLIKLTVTPPYPPHGGPRASGLWKIGTQNRWNFIDFSTFS